LSDFILFRERNSLKFFVISCALIFLPFKLFAVDEQVKANLDSCISYYQDGEYQKAVDSIKALLPLISDRRDEAEAYKYIGFSYVMLDMIGKAKDFFKVALEKFPQLEIDTLDVPPNITIVFKQTKLETQMEKGEIVEKGKQGNGPVIATLFGATAVVSGAVGGFFLYQGLISRRNYHRLGTNSPPDQFPLYWNNYVRQTLAGGTLLGFAGACAASAIAIVHKRPSTKKPHAALDLHSDRIALTWFF
jgi:tetratricopeptide (TPR) repeat protein